LERQAEVEREFHLDGLGVGDEGYKQSRSRSHYSDLDIEIRGNPRCIDITKMMQGGLGVLEIRSRATGTVTLKIRRRSGSRGDDGRNASKGLLVRSVDNVNDDFEGKTGINDVSELESTTTVHVSILPSPVSSSLELQELIHITQAAFATEKADLILHAQALRSKVYSSVIRLSSCTLGKLIFSSFIRFETMRLRCYTTGTPSS
jgi:hypothetical protein